MPEWKQEIRQRLACLKLAPAREAAIVEELAQHLDDCYAELLAGGATEAEAERRTLAELSGNELLARELRRVERQVAPEPIVPGNNRRANMIAALWQDLRFGARMLLKRPGFTLIAVIMLAMGSGATTAIFTLFNALLLRPLPYPGAERLVSIEEVAPDGNPIRAVSAANLKDWRERNRVFERMAGFQFEGFNLSGTEEAQAVMGALVSPELFDMLGVKAAAGRLFLPEDARPEAEGVVVLSHGLWRRQFGADPQVIGRQIKLYSVDSSQAAGAYTVIGVLPEWFWFVSGQFEVWTPERFTPAQMADRTTRSSQVIALLKPGVTVAQAQAEMQGIARLLSGEQPELRSGQVANTNINVVSLQDRLLGEPGAAMLVLLGAVCLALLIVCANLANLLLTRAAARQKEISIRAAMGAGRFRLVRLLLTENLLMAGLGAVGGLLLAVWFRDLLVALIPSEAQGFIPGGGRSVTLDWRVLLFALSAAILTGLIIGVAPAMAVTRRRLNDLLKEGSGATLGIGRRRLSSLLVIAEVALSLVLLVGAGLTIKSLWRMRQADLGFNPENVLKAELSLSRGKYSQPGQQAEVIRRILERVTALPGVEAASVTNNYPLRLPNRALFVIEGRPAPSADNLPAAASYVVSPDYFHTITANLRAGRAFDERDTAQSQPVVIISDAAAKRFFPDEDPLGKRVRLGGLNSQSPWAEIIGIAPDVRQELSPEPIYPALYRPYQQAPGSFVFLLARTANAPPSLAPAVRREIAAIDPDQPVAGLASLRQVTSEAAWGQRFSTLLLAIFGAAALSLSALGIYGVIAYAVAQRTHEIGVRVALGAQPRDLMRLVLRQGLLLTLIGVGLGLIGALALTKVLAGLLFGLSASDPLTFAGVAALMILVGLLACYIPARWATKVDPMVALRRE